MAMTPVVPVTSAVPKRHDGPGETFQNVSRRTGPRSIAAILQAREVAVHILRAPTLIPGEFSDIVPVTVLRRDGDHGVVCGAATQRARAGIPDSVNRLLTHRILLYEF